MPIDIELNAGRGAAVLLGVGVLLGCTVAYVGKGKEPLSKIPAEQREPLQKRLDAYVQAYRARKWERLYELVSGTGRGGATRSKFVARMKAEHGTGFANMPDLLEFHPDRVYAGDGGGYDIYGCGKARREGLMFNGIAVTHAVFEHDDWFFTGWSFTEFPNERCEALSDPGWKPENTMRWDQPMEEVQPELQSVPVHVDSPKR